MHTDPYITGNAIRDSDKFFGRQDIFREVMRVLHHPYSNAIVLYGQRRIGKTSVLLQLQQQLKIENQYTPVYFDLQDKADKPLTNVLYDLARWIAIAINRDVPLIDNFDMQGAYFRDVFLPEATQQAGKAGLVLLFDEFDVLDDVGNSQAGASFFPYLRELLSQAKKVQFVFVLGRRPEDLSTNTIATFREAEACKVGLLAKRDIEAIVRQSEKQGTLFWDVSAIDRIWSWTQGHPFFTQLLCSVVWGSFYVDPDEDPAAAPHITSKHIPLKIVDQALMRGANAFHYIWEGLPPAERVVMSAIAQAETEIITLNTLRDILYHEGVNLIVRDLQQAPDILANWGLLEAVNGLQETAENRRYRVAVPLLRQWVETHYPLHQVKRELDKLDPLANDTFHQGLRLFKDGMWEQAAAQFEAALNINPNHQNARLRLGTALLRLERVEEAVTELDTAYQTDPENVRPELTQALLKLAEQERSEVRQLAIYKRVLEMVPHQPEAVNRETILLDKQRQRRLDAAIRSQREWEKAIEIYEGLLETSPEQSRKEEWESLLTEAQQGAQRATKFVIAVEAVQEGKATARQQIMVDAVALQPTYEEMNQYLLRSTAVVQEAILEQEYITANRNLQVLLEDAQETLHQHEQQLHIANDKLSAALKDVQKHLRANRALKRSNEELRLALAESHTEQAEEIQLQRENEALQEQLVTLQQQVKDNTRQQKLNEQLQAALERLEADYDIKNQALIETKKQLQAAQEANRTTTEIADTVTEPALGQLNPWQPLDYIRLLWWLLVHPEKAAAYEAAHGQPALKAARKWWGSVLIWFPFFLGALSLVDNSNITLGSITIPGPLFFLVALLVWGMSVLTMRLSRRQNDGIPAIVSLVGCGLVYIIIHSLGDWRAGALILLCVLVTSSFANVVELIIGGIITGGVIGLGVGFLNSTEISLTLFIWGLGIVAGIGGAIGANILSDQIMANVQTQKTPAWTSAVFFVTILLYTLLVWYVIIDLLRPIWQG